MNTYSTGDFTEALQSLLGSDCPGLSATTITRLVAQWQDEHQQWSQRDLSDKHYFYVWADGIHFNIREEGIDRGAGWLSRKRTIVDGHDAGPEEARAEFIFRG